MLHPREELQDLYTSILTQIDDSDAEGEEMKAHKLRELATDVKDKLDVQGLTGYEIYNVASHIRMRLSALHDKYTKIES